MSKPKRRRIPLAVVERQCPPGCGWCCDPVALPFTQEYVRNAKLLQLPTPLDEGTVRWVLEDLTPIPRREGLLRAPYMTGGGRTTFAHPVTGEFTMVLTHFFECRHFDRDTRSCSNYEGRPSACRDFPWGGSRPDPQKALPAPCVFLEDIGVRPQPLS